MDLIIKILRHKLTKIFIFLLAAAFILSIYFYKDWYGLQYHKALGFYYVYKADKAYKKQEYQKATDLYKAALLNYPGHSKASCNLGNIYVSFENYPEAVKYYKNALEYSPDFMSCRMNLGIILSEKNAEYDSALKEYEGVINSNPFTIHIPLIYNNIDMVKQNKGIAYYNSGLAYRSKSLFNNEESAAYKININKALESYQNAGKYLKNNFDNTYNLALTAHLAGEYSLAAQEYCNAINLNPESFDAHYNFAVLLYKMRLYKDALEELEKTLFLTDYTGDEKKTKYILNLIEKVKKRTASSGGADYLKKHESLTMLKSGDIVYSNGKIKAENQKDIDINGMMKCTYNTNNTDAVKN